jgi:hypothetical protein
MIYLIDPTPAIKEICTEKKICSPRFIPLYGVPV